MAAGRTICIAAAAFAVFLTTGGPAPARDSTDALIGRLNQTMQSGDWAGCLTVSSRLEPIIRRHSGAQSPNFAGMLHNEAMCLHNIGRYQEAAAKLEAALPIKQRGGDIASYLRSANLLADTYVTLERSGDALVVVQRALALASPALPPDSPLLAPLYSELGKVAQDQERNGEAETYFSRALALLQSAPNVDPRDLADAMDNLGDQEGRNGRFDDGEQLLKQALATLDGAFGAQAQRASNYSRTLNDLGYLYKDAGRFAEAEATFRKALASVEQTLGPQHPNTAATMGNLALVLNATSHYAEAEKLFQQTLAIYERTFGPDHPMVAIALNNLAGNYLDQGRAADAAGLQRRVVAIRERTGGPDSPDLARALTNLANNETTHGQLDEGLPLYQRALAIMAKRFGPDSLQAEPALVSFAGAALDRGRVDDAANAFASALKADEKAYGPGHPALVPALRGLAQVALRRNDFDTARTTLQRALAISEASFGPDSRQTLATLINLADVAARQNDWAQAAALLRRAATRDAATLSGATAGTAEADASGTFLDLYPALLDALWHLSNGQPDAALTNEAFVAAQRLHQTQAGAALAQMAVRFGSGNDAVARAVRRQQDLKASLNSLDKRIVSELGLPQGRRNDKLIAGLRAEQARAQKSHDEAAAQILREFPRYAELTNPAPLQIAQAQALLKSDEALVAFAGLKDQTFVFAVTREGAVWQRIALGRGDLNTRVAALRKGLFDDSPDAKSGTFDLAASYALYHDLIGPIEKVIAAKSRLAIVPTGPLTSLPFHVLVTAPPDPAIAAADRFRKAAWLLRTKATFVLPSVGSLRALRAFAQASRATKPFIGFGDPQFQREGSGRRSRSLTVGPYQDYYTGTSINFDFLRKHLPALPDTADELQAVARALGADARDVHLGADASVTHVAELQLDQYRVVDFATHGLIAGEVSGLSEPALVLSLPDHPTASDDGLLTASRVAKLSLDADWAVLSACNTAAGETPGAEGLSGLARAFFYAGARALLVSNWPVQSDAAVRLTTGAFKAIADDPGIGRAEALRRSMAALIDDASSPDNADPSAWAPFIVVGEGGAAK